MKLFHVSVRVTRKAGGRDTPVTDAAFFVRSFGAKLHGPKRPRRLRRALVRRLRHDLKLVHRERLLTVTRPETICAGVAATDNDHTLARSKNLDGRIDRISVAAFVLLRKEFHRVVNPFQLAARNLEVAGLL